MLETFGKSLADFNLPNPDERGLQWRNRDMPPNMDELSVAEHTEAAEAMQRTLNDEQRVI